MSNVWAKTTLSAYPYLIKIADAIDRVVERRAMNSFYVSGSDFSRNNVYDLANQLLGLSDRKVVLINLKILVENTLKKCDKFFAKLLIAKYISRKKSAEICELLNVAQRTYFRKIKEAEKQFEVCLRAQGYDQQKLLEFLGEEEWIMDIKEQYENSRKEEVELTGVNLKKVAL